MIAKTDTIDTSITQLLAHRQAMPAFSDEARKHTMCLIETFIEQMTSVSIGPSDAELRAIEAEFALSLSLTEIYSVQDGEEGMANLHILASGGTPVMALSYSGDCGGYPALAGVYDIDVALGIFNVFMKHRMQRVRERRAPAKGTSLLDQLLACEDLFRSAGEGTISVIKPRTTGRDFEKLFATNKAVVFAAGELVYVVNFMGWTQPLDDSLTDEQHLCRVLTASGSYIVDARAIFFTFNANFSPEYLHSLKATLLEDDYWIPHEIKVLPLDARYPTTEGHRNILVWGEQHFKGCRAPQSFSFKFVGKVTEHGEFKTWVQTGIKQQGVVSWNHGLFNLLVKETHADIPRKLLADPVLA